MAKKLNARAAAAQLAWQIIDQGQSLDAVLTRYFDGQAEQQDRGLIQELVYGQCRWYGELNSIAEQLLRSPIRNKDRVIHFVLLTGLYQLRYLDTAQHAAVSETVSACKQLNKVWAKNLINGCLRTYMRKTDNGEFEFAETQNEIAHPEWIASAIKQAWPDSAADIFAANNQRPPMCLRVNRTQGSLSAEGFRDQYLTKLNDSEISAIADPYSEEGIILQKAVPVFELPNFYDGAVSVQDTAAQLAAYILNAKPGQTVLDACAAPGGKTAHVLERAVGDITMTALDVSDKRCDQLRDTLKRLKLNAHIEVADATKQPTWVLPDSGYDRILIDAPCSGLGVIRRHPDIKHHRRASDIEALNQIQLSLLNNLWHLLKPGGQLLYMTCSILPSENDELVGQFVEHKNDAMLKPIDHPNALKLSYGTQTLPGVHGMDGFYYSLIEKNKLI